jgi:hypothetical protein
MQSPFMKLYIAKGESHHDAKDGIWDPTSPEGQDFRDHFHLPYALFDEKVQQWELVDTTRSCDRFRLPCSDQRLFVLGVLHTIM